jgi:hypothetical protein
MNFFGLFGTSEEQKTDSEKVEENTTGVTEVDVANLSKHDSDKIFSNYDAETGKVKTSLYNPPSLLLQMQKPQDDSRKFEDKAGDAPKSLYAANNTQK